MTSAGFRVAALCLAERPGADRHPVLTDEEVDRVTDRVFAALQAEQSRNGQPLRLVPVRHRSRR